MGQHLSNINSSIINWTNKDEAIHNFDSIVSMNGKENINLFLSMKILADTTTNHIQCDNNNRILNSEKLLTKQIQTYLLTLIKGNEFIEINTKIDTLLLANGFIPIVDHYQQMFQDMKIIFDKQCKLRKTLKEKLYNDNNTDPSIFLESSSTENDTHRFAYFSIQLLTSLLLVSIRTNEKVEPLISLQIIILTTQLCEQIPIEDFYSCKESLNNNKSLMFKSLKPLINYISELSLSNDHILAKQSVEVLLKLSIVQGSFKDLLSIICRMIFDTTNLYNLQHLFQQMNDCLTEFSKQYEPIKQQLKEELQQDNITNKILTDTLPFISLNYLKSNGVYPNTELAKLHQEQFNGQFISSIILSYIDIYNEINLTKQFNNGSISSSISFEFHPHTFKQLFDTLEQLATVMKQNSNPILTHILIVWIRLLSTHLQFLCTIKSNTNRTLLLKNDDKSIETVLDSDDIDLTIFASDTELQKWFDLLVTLTCYDQYKSESIVIRREVSKILIYLIDFKSSSFIEKLSIIYHYVMENKYNILIKQLFLELNKRETLLDWIETLCENISEQNLPLKILYSFVDIYLDGMNDFNEECRQQIEQVLESFQQFFLIRLVPQSRLKQIQNNTVEESKFNTLETSIDVNSALVFSRYISHVFKIYLNKTERINIEFINQILIGLAFMTQTEIFSFDIVQPIFIAVLPLLASYILQYTNNEQNKMHFLYWLIGRMTYVIIIGSEKDLLEIKHMDKLKSLLFIDGCERTVIENSRYLLNLFQSNLTRYNDDQQWNKKEQSLSSSDQAFLMSVYNNIDQGAQLISKIQIYVRNQRQILKSIEQHVFDACAALFAVYLKHYRRVNIARSELSRTDNQRPHSKLVSLYEYASNVEILFITTKAQGGDCDQLCEQIKIKSLFLLSTIAENHFIPIIQEDLSQLRTETNPAEINDRSKAAVVFQGQRSQWTKAKHIFTVLRHTLHACIRLKKLMLAKRQAIQQNEDNESILHQQIYHFVCDHSDTQVMSVKNEDIQLELNELTQCLIRQYERGMTRLVAYRFIHIFIQKILQIEDKNRIFTILTIYLPFLRKFNVNWSYLEHIDAINNKLKENIRKYYYSIIKIILSLIGQSKQIEQYIFNLLNLSYNSMDVCLLSQHQLTETLFKLNVSFIEERNRIDSLQRKLIGYNWFRFYVLKLCQINEKEEFVRQQQDFIFNTLILNELKGLRRLKEMIHIDDKDDNTHSIEYENHSLENCSIGWFLHATKDQTSFFSSKFQIELCINQWLTLVLRCVHLYEHLQSICGTIDFIEELLCIYRTSNNRITILLVLKILRNLLSSLPNNRNNISETIMENLLNEFLFSIGNNDTSQSISPEIVTELIYIYRTIMLRKSPWQLMAIHLVFNSVATSLTTINWTTLEINDKKSWNYLVASIYILGGYIEPYGLGSIVNIHTEKENGQGQLGVIIEIVKNDHDQTMSDPMSYLVQYLDQNKTERLTTSQLETQVTIPLTNLLTLSNRNGSNLTIHSLLDTLGYILQIDQPNQNDLRLLRLKRCCITALNQILTHKAIIEIFIQKSYSSLIGRLSMMDTSKEHDHQLTDLHLFNRLHLEQYCLSLDRYERETQAKLMNKLTTDIPNVYSVNIEEKHADVRPNQLIVDSSSNDSIRYNEWKPYASKAEIDSYKKGRNGREKLSIVPLPSDVADLGVIEECGNKHRFKGRIYLNHQHNHERFPSFIFENLTLSEGNWYYCVKLPAAGLVQIGWATDGFSPQSSQGEGIGDDRYSWSFDGSRGTLYHDQEFHYLPRTIRWKPNDVCGCGIEINGENTRIKYWLNGEFLGTAFAHQENIASTTVKCNLLPHGLATKFFPGVTVQSSWLDEGICELIVSPEDMNQCPLPNGYKPLLMPQCIRSTNSLVAYPYSAYLVGDNIQDFILTPRNTPSTKFLRDFINEQHIETTLTICDDQLRLTEDSDGFPFSLENSRSSFTISFDFHLLNKSDIILFKLQTIEQYSARISLTDHTELTKVVLVIDIQTREIQIYLNNSENIFQTIHLPSDHPTITKFYFQILPNVSVGIENFALWKYALSPEHIKRLFLNGLSYVANDYRQQNEYRLEANTFTFRKDQTYFSNQFLVPFNENFTEAQWKEKQKQIDMDESKFFQADDKSNNAILQFYGNKTYIVIQKSAEQWSTYTIILDILIPNLPIEGERLSLVLINLRTHFYITSTGHICLVTADACKNSEGKIKLNQWIRLLIHVENTLLKIYVDGSIIFDIHVEENALNLLGHRLHLFRELDLCYNTMKHDTLRIQCKSATFLNRSIEITHLKKIFQIPQYSLELLVVPPFSRHVSSLVCIGYNIEWIKTVMRQYHTVNLQFIDTIIREHQDDISRIDIQRQKECHLNTLLRLSSTIDQEKLKNLINTNDPFTTNCKLLLILWNDLQTIESHVEKSSNDDDEIHFIFTQWIRHQSQTSIENVIDSQLFDFLIQSNEKQTLTRTGIILQRTHVQTSFHYSHQNISFEQYRQSRIVSENGLISIYARDILFNMINIWSNTNSDRFPFDRLIDHSLIVKLLRVIHIHSICTNSNFNTRFDPMAFIIKSILKDEIKILFEEINSTSSIVLSEDISLLEDFQKEILIQSMEFFFQISLSINEFENTMSIIEKQVNNERMNLDFILTILNLFIELINDQSIIKQKEIIDRFIPLIFSESLLNVMFDLFLILPTFQSKIFILDLFLSLMRISKQFHLNQRIKNFILNFTKEFLLNEKSTNNRIMKTFQILLIDFIYLQIDTISELPEIFQDFSMICNIFKAINNQSPYPDMLLVHASNIFNENLLFTFDDLAISNVYFDQIADVQLLNLMNNDVLINHSFDEFIFSLVDVYSSNSIFFDHYPSLVNIPIDCVQNRAKLFYLINVFVERVLSFIDLTLPRGKSFLIDQIRLVKKYLLKKKRMTWFEQSLKESKTTTSSSFSYSEIKFDILPEDSPDSCQQVTTFDQAFDQLHANAHILFRSDDTSRLWRATYLRMHSIDQGGPYRDSITSMSSDICSRRLSLFILCPNGRMNNGLNRDRWIPNVFAPNEVIPVRIKKQYQFVGQLMGMAIRRKHYLDLKFPNLLWKQLLGEQITIQDIEAIDIQSFVLIEEMENNLEQNQFSENGNDSNYLFSSIMSELRFDIVSSAGHSYELIPNGSDIPITADNFKEYCRYYREYRLNEFSRQIEYIRQGLYSVVANDFLQFLTTSELEEAICGKSRIDIDLLKRNTQYHQSNSDSSPYIERFWHVLKEMFTEEQKKLFLKFVWGRNTLPSRDEDFIDKFSINLLNRNEYEVDRMLPRSNTCSFTLHLPSYSSTQIMYDRLNYSITHCLNVDGDG